MFGLRRRPGTQTGIDPATVKLLFDHNLSYRLVRALQREYPDSQHVREVGLSEATDEAVWRHAMEQGFTIVTKDSELGFRESLIVPLRSKADVSAALREPRGAMQVVRKRHGN